MRKKIIILPVLMLLIAIGLVGLVSADCTFNDPDAGSENTGAVIANVTCTIASTENCTITGTSSASGGELTSFHIYNNTEDADLLNGTFNTVGERDAADWSITGTCYNSTGDSETITPITLTINNGVPVISGCTITRDGITAVTAVNGTISESDFIFVCTVQNATACNQYWKTTTSRAFASTVQSGEDYALNAITMTTTYSVTAGVSLTANLKQAGDDPLRLYMDCTDGTDTTIGTHYNVMAEGIWEPDLTEEEREGIAPQIISRVRGLDKQKVAMFGLFVVIVAIIVGFAIKKLKK